LLIYADSTQHTKLEGETSAGKLNGHSGRKREDEKAQAVNCRTGVRYPHQLYGITKNMDKGIKKCKQIYLGAAIAYNLKKWLNYREQKLKTAVMAMKKPAKGLCFYFLAACCFRRYHNTQFLKLFTAY
jgi:hypothetical protein